MGRFLTISVNYAVSVAQKDLETNQISAEELGKKLHLSDAIYQRTEQADEMTWKIKDTVLETHLLTLLQDFYPNYYTDKNYYKHIMSELEGKNASFLIDYAEQKSAEAYQMDSYFDPLYVSFHEKPFQPYVRAYPQGIILALEGKIMMETYGQMFELLTKSLRKQFAPNPLAETLNLAITG